MKAVLKVLRGIIAVFNIISVAGLLFILLLTFANVILRYVFSAPIAGSYEMTRMGMIVLTPGIAVTILAKQAIWVDVLTSKFNRIGQMIVDAITLPTATVILGLLAWQNFNMIETSMRKDTHFTAVKFFGTYMREWPFRVVFFIAMAVATIAALTFTIERLLQYRNGGMPHDENEVDAAVKKFDEDQAAQAAQAQAVEVQPQIEEGGAEA